MSGEHYLKLFDIGKLWLAVTVLSGFYMEWLRDLTPISGFDVAVEFHGVWRHVALVDFDSWAQHVEELGLPVLMRDRIRAPATGSSRVNMDEDLWLVLCGNLSLAAGIPGELFSQAYMEVLLGSAQRQQQVGS
jgi:hypothetical protein